MQRLRAPREKVCISVSVRPWHAWIRPSAARTAGHRTDLRTQLLSHAREEDHHIVAHGPSLRRGWRRGRLGRRRRRLPRKAGEHAQGAADVRHGRSCGRSGSRRVSLAIVCCCGRGSLRPPIFDPKEHQCGVAGRQFQREIQFNGGRGFRRQQIHSVCPDCPLGLLANALERTQRVIVLERSTLSTPSREQSTQRGIEPHPSVLCTNVEAARRGVAQAFCSRLEQALQDAV